MWTHFMDMHSGGGSKEPYEHIFIEAPEDEACVIFYNRFGHNPHRVTCTCCGSDYSVSEHDDLAQATAYERGCDSAYFDSDGNEVDGYTYRYGDGKNYTWRYVERKHPGYTFHPYMSLDAYKASGKALFITDAEIPPQQRVGSLPAQGYVWVD